jgi:hypothetical protein
LESGSRGRGEELTPPAGGENLGANFDIMDLKNIVKKMQGEEASEQNYQGGGFADDRYDQQAKVDSQMENLRLAQHAQYAQAQHAQQKAQAEMYAGHQGQMDPRAMANMGMPGKGGFNMFGAPQKKNEPAGGFENLLSIFVKNELGGGSDDESDGMPKRGPAGMGQMMPGQHPGNMAPGMMPGGPPGPGMQMHPGNGHPQMHPGMHHQGYPPNPNMMYTHGGQPLPGQQLPPHMMMQGGHPHAQPRPDFGLGEKNGTNPQMSQMNSVQQQMYLAQKLGLKTDSRGGPPQQ